MKTVLDILNEVGATDSRKEKEAILSRYGLTEHLPVLRSVISYAYSKNITYGVKVTADDLPTEYTSEIGLLDGFSVLDSLASRHLIGNTAIQTIKDTAAKMSRDDAVVFFRIINRDLRCGCAESTFNKVFGNVIESPPYQRCTSFSKKALSKIKFPCVSEIKADGMYIDIIVSYSDVVYRSRSGDVKNFNIARHDDILTGIAKERGGFVLMGEALVLDWTQKIMSREDGNGYLNSDDIDPNRIIFQLWDYVPLVEYLNGKSNRKLHTRQADLDELLQRLEVCGIDSYSEVEREICNNIDDVVSHFKRTVSQGLEGLVLKNTNAVWKNGTSSDQVKLKVEVECDLRVVDLNEGEGKYKNSVGAMVCQTSCGDLVVNVSGLKDAARKDFWQNRHKIIDKIVTVRFNDVVFSETTNKHSLFLPRFVEVREDKTEADSLLRVFEQLESVEEIIKMMFDGV